MSLRRRLAALEKAAVRLGLGGMCSRCGRTHGHGRPFVFDPEGVGLGECPACRLPVDQEGLAVGYLAGETVYVKVYGFPDPEDAEAFAAWDERER